MLSGNGSFDDLYLLFTAPAEPFCACAFSVHPRVPARKRRVYHLPTGNSATNAI